MSSDLAEILARRKREDLYDPLADDDTYVEPYPPGFFYRREKDPNPYAERKISVKKHLGTGLDPEKHGVATMQPTRKKPAALNPKSMAVLEARGYTAEVVEWYDARHMRKHDFLGCIDVLAFKPGEPVLAIQLTDFGHMEARKKKALALPKLIAWIRAGNRFVVHGWKRPSAPGQRWELVEREVFATDLPEAVPKKRSSLWD